ncbi:MAG: SDR family NAD(P)-dependent oxidoreductase, partial [Alphaproteobacteria bacterium]|nr:SDR family NAD(P)-dependent oxidoreductase [Alphaproteobacteria bacterium]
AAIEAAGGEVVIACLDVVDTAAVGAVSERIGKTFGRLDILVNNAGINVPNRSWGRIDSPAWNQVINIDLNGAFYCCQAALPMMREQREGLIVNVASWAGVHVSKMTGPAYTAAKHALVAMTESLNMEECANGIRACALCPGEVATAALEDRPTPVSAEVKGNMLQADDVAETILFLAHMPTHVCLNEIIISPTRNRLYLEEAC